MNAYWEQQIALIHVQTALGRSNVAVDLDTGYKQMGKHVQVQI